MKSSNARFGFKHIFVVLIPVVLLGQWGCSRAFFPVMEEGGGGDENPWKGVARESYAKARTSMLQEEEVYVDVLWVLNQFSREDEELHSFIEQAKGGVPDKQYVPGVFPDVSRVELPEDPGSGIKRFITYLSAPFGQPEERAMAYLREYVFEEVEGYILTHQFLVLVWAEQAGLPLTKDLFLRRDYLWEKVYEELVALDDMDSIDLFMERVAIVLAYGKAENIEEVLVEEWMERIVEFQLEGGFWPVSKTRISYDGASTQLTSPRAHTTALAMMALDAYICNCQRWRR